MRPETIIKLKMKKMKKYLIIVRHLSYEEMWATTNDFKTAVKYAREAVAANKGKKVVIQ